MHFPTPFMAAYTYGHQERKITGKLSIKFSLMVCFSTQCNWGSIQNELNCNATMHVTCVPNPNRPLMFFLFFYASGVSTGFSLQWECNNTLTVKKVEEGRAVTCSKKVMCHNPEYANPSSLIGCFWQRNRPLNATFHYICATAVKQSSVATVCVQPWGSRGPSLVGLSGTRGSKTLAQLPALPTLVHPCEWATQCMLMCVHLTHYCGPG